MSSSVLLISFYLKLTALLLKTNLSYLIETNPIQNSVQKLKTHRNQWNGAQKTSPGTLGKRAQLGSTIGESQEGVTLVPELLPIN